MFRFVQWSKIIKETKKKGPKNEKIKRKLKNSFKKISPILYFYQIGPVQPMRVFDSDLD